jgi:hypothetical protein
MAVMLFLQLGALAVLPIPTIADSVATVTDANLEAIPPVQYNHTISSIAGGSATRPGEGTFTYGAGKVVHLMAIPDAVWVPYVPTPEEVEILPITSGTMTGVRVTLRFSSVGYRVVDWGTVERVGNEFSADAKIERYTGSVIMIMPSPITHEYELGEVSGGNCRFTFKAWGCSIKTIEFTPTPPAPTIITTSLPNGRIGASYSQTLHATGGATPYTWSIMAHPLIVGSGLPTGLALNATTGVISGTPTQDPTVWSFTAVVTDNLTAQGTRALSISVAPVSSDKAITAFNFNGLIPAVIGIISEATHTIALTVPSGTAVTALVPTITHTGASVSPAGGIAHNFTTNTQTYTVTAANSSIQAYAVTVTVAANPLTVTNNPATNITTTSATLNGTLASDGGAADNVTVYWGATDGVTTAGNWGHNVPLGDQATGDFSAGITGLNAGTTYYYRCSAANPAGTAWATSSSSLVTHASGINIIADHNCTDISQIPPAWRDNAKSTLKIWYGHTSHGSQITTGMQTLQSLYSATYNFNADGSGGALSYQEVSADLGTGGDLGWRDATRSQLDRTDNDRNVVVWSWCGGVSTSTEGGIGIYLAAMNQLETDYPGVTFVYMTGHLDGTGEAGNLNVRNNQIRNYCIANNKILFDFADIESYDPDGNYFLDLSATDNCTYNSGNWAQEWCAAHPSSELCDTCVCAHSQSLNCNLKGRAFWWMLARVAGCALPDVTSLPATSVTGATATLNGTLTNSGGEACQYRFCRGISSGVYTDNTTWSGPTDNRTTGQSFSAGLTGLVPGTKYYFIAQARNSAGTGSGLEMYFTSAHTMGDYNGDGQADYAVYRPGNYTWYVLGSTNYPAWGLSGDKLVPADYNGDNKTEYAVWRPSSGVWYVYGGVPGPQAWGVSTDIPVPADYNGDGKAEFAVWRHSNGTWYVYGGGPGYQAWGVSTDIPVPADYNGDGKAEYAVWRPSTGVWYVYGSGSYPAWGVSTDTPVPADYNGDGKAEFAVYRPGNHTWYVRGSSSYPAWGLAGDTLVPADYNGDGKAEYAVWRPGNGTWYVLGSTSYPAWGVSTDIPVVR